MNIAISGSTGFVGSQLVNAFREREFKITPIRRRDFMLTDEELADKIEGSQVIIHLAGAPILKRWTNSHKKAIYNSRINTTRKLSGAIANMKNKPQLFISSSAVGIYKSDKTYTENNAEYDKTFLAKVCIDWEKEAVKADDHTHVVIFRFGTVLGRNGGALKTMLPPFKMGIGGVLGNGEQAFSWIHITDLVDAYLFAMESELYEGIYNLTSPHPVTNYEFTKALGKALHRPSFFPIPKFALKALYGEGANVLLDGQRIIPENLQKAGFNFRFPHIEEALEDLFAK
ncbi:MAG: TIGR01777 family oxidoreductase [Bacteroidales bacterium]|nr:TIGR01777 family oxidoreductase [Bacteroidales bacterium]